MALRLAPEISLRRFDGPGPAGDQASAVGEPQPRSEVLLRGEPTGRVLNAAWLEAAVACADGRYLLFTTDDIPHEEFLGVVLLSPQWQVLDKASIGVCYGTGTFESLSLHGADRLHFLFAGPYPWELRVLDAPAWRLPWPREAAGVWRRAGWSRHFVLRQVKGG